MNRYPAWGYALIALAIVAAFLYTLPNFFGESPAVQVSSGKATVRIEQSMLARVEQALRDAAREYHRNPSRGKISVNPTKPLSNQRDLSLAYSPGVAYPCLDIQADPTKAFDFTSRGNLVAVITNGTAVLGLGNIGPLASKPVM